MDIFISIISLVGFVALTGSTGLFVAIEFALTGLERSTVVNHVRDKNDRSALAVQRDYQNLSFVLSGAQLGITVTTLATGFLAEPVLSSYFTPLLELVGLSESASTAVALVLALIVATFLSMVFGELVPKNVAITMPLNTARVVVHPVHVFNMVFKWFIVAMNRSANFIVRKLGIEPADELATARSNQELGSLVRSSAQQGGLDINTARVIDRSLQFGEATANEFMTPRSTIAYLGAEDTVDDLIAKSLETGHSRFPVVRGDLDDTVGVVHVKDAFAVPREARAMTLLGSLAKKVPVVPDTLDGDAVLSTVRSAGSQVVLVADEYGGTAGLVTLEDALEEIVGDLADEGEQPVEPVRQVGPDEYLVRGDLAIHDWPNVFGVDLPAERISTIGGLVMSLLGRVPAVGDEVRTGNLRFTVEAMQAMRVRRVRLRIEPEGRP